jgi:carbon-monoxide dehydrogenase medium subunit
MIPRQFEYHAPQSLPEAVELLQKYGDTAKLLAGGHSLLPMMKIRFAEPEHLVDLGGIADLKGIREENNELRIGAMTTENDLIWSEIVQEKCPLLAEGAGLIADPQVRYKGTIGGDISHGDPANDHPALMLALRASFVLRGANGERVVAVDDFFLDTYFTALEPDEVLTEIRIPVPAAGAGWSYTKLKRKTGDFATAAAAVMLSMSGDTVDDVSIALTNAGATALRAKEAEDSLRGNKLDEAAISAAAQHAMSICDPVEDQRGDVEYKTMMSGEMTRRALGTAQSRVSA